MDCNDYSCSGQMDIFDFLEDKNKVKEFNPLKALALCGTGFRGGMKRVNDYFLENHNLREKVAFLKKEYGTGGFGSPAKKPCYIHGMCTATSQKLIEYEYYDENMQDIKKYCTGLTWRMLLQKWLSIMSIFTERVIDTAIYRNVRLSFWTDNKVIDNFTPEDKYFYLYLLTNPQTNLCGCYEISYKSMSEDTGYNKDTCLRLLKRFDEVHNVIKFNENTKEILILNWYKYNWSSSTKTITGVISTAKHIKCEKFRNYVLSVAESVKNGNEVPKIYPIEASVSDTVYASVTETDTANNKKNHTGEDIKEIVNYLNKKCGTHYRCNTANTRKHITARFADGYTVSDFITVIDKKSAEWQGTKFELYLRPDTLFGSKFESYLNQQIKQKDNTKEFLGGWGL